MIIEFYRKCTDLVNLYRNNDPSIKKTVLSNIVYYLYQYIHFVFSGVGMMYLGKVNFFLLFISFAGVYILVEAVLLVLFYHIVTRSSS